MQRIIEKHPHQFEGFMNLELFKKISELGAGKDAAILQFSQEHQIEYAGELAERWTEREIIKSEKDLVAMNLALAWVSSNSQFMYNQKEIYAEKTLEYIKEHNLSQTSLITLMYFMSRNGIDLEVILNELIQTENQSTGFEHVSNIHFLTKVYSSNSHLEELLQLCCSYLDGMELTLDNPFEDYTKLYLLSEGYIDLDKPKANSFKTKGMSRLLQTIGNLRWKEVDWHNRNTPANVLGISTKDVITYNYILATNFKARWEQKITGPGFERIHENLLRAHYTDSSEFPEELVIDVTTLKAFHETDDYYGSSPFGKMFRKHLTEVPHNNLIHLMSHVSDEEFNKRINPDYIRFLKDNLLETCKEEAVVEKLLVQLASALEEEDFRFLETKREQLNLSFARTSQTYIDALIEYRFIDLVDTKRLEEKDYLKGAIAYVKKNKSTAEFLRYLDPLEPKYYSCLKDLDILPTEEEDSDPETLRLYHKLVLKDLFTNKPTQYADRLFIYLQDDQFLKLFEYTAADVEELERQLYDNQMLSETNHKTLHKKLTPKEVLEFEYLENAKKKIIKKLNDSHAQHNFDELIQMCVKRPALTQTLAESLAKVTIFNNYGTTVQEFLLMIYKAKAYLNISDEQLALLDMKVIDHITGKEAKSA